jgi:hypothetical protein
MKTAFPILSPLIDINTPNALLSGKIRARASSFSDAATC